MNSTLVLLVALTTVGVVNGCNGPQSEELAKRMESLEARLSALEAGAGHQGPSEENSKTAEPAPPTADLKATNGSGATEDLVIGPGFVPSQEFIVRHRALQDKHSGDEKSLRRKYERFVQDSPTCGFRYLLYRVLPQSENGAYLEALAADCPENQWVVHAVVHKLLFQTKDQVDAGTVAKMLSDNLADIRPDFPVAENENRWLAEAEKAIEAARHVSALPKRITAYFERSAQKVEAHVVGDVAKFTHYDRHGRLHGKADLRLQVSAVCATPERKPRGFYVLVQIAKEGRFVEVDRTDFSLSDGQNEVFSYDIMWRKMIDNEVRLYIPIKDAVKARYFLLEHFD